MRHRLEFLLFQSFKWVVLALPLKSAQRLGSFVGGAAFYLVAPRRRIARENLLHAFPGKSPAERDAIAKGAFRNYGITIAEFLWFPNLDDESLRKLVRIRNPLLLEPPPESGKGMIMLSGHFGNWELIALAVAYLSGLQITIIVQTQSNKLVDRVLNRHRCLFGNKVVPMGMSVREIVRALDSGGIIAIAPDQSGPKEGVFVEFFGRRVATHQGPAAFALRGGARMQMGFIIRQADGCYEVILEEIQTADLNREAEESIIELTRRHTALLEKYIHLYPDHWQWMHRRWKHTWESVQKEKSAAKNVYA